MIGAGWFGGTELLIILGIVVLIFGARRLPEIGSGLGKAIKKPSDETPPTS
jgi:sec-independent protein translocase protein TatA